MARPLGWWAVAAAALLATAVALRSPHYEATAESLRQHKVPDWFNEAKLGVMVHWTPSSVPAFAPVDADVAHLLAQKGFAAFYRENPYAEWYGNTMRINGSATDEHHRRTYGSDYPYRRFAVEFHQRANASFNADAWAELMQAAGARYAVMVTKHHDGFTLWPSSHREKRLSGYYSKRDYVGEVASAVRARGLRFGVYYSGGLDWAFRQDDPIVDIASLLRCKNDDPDYGDYADAHLRELIKRYSPSILWGDLGYPKSGQWPQIHAEYYNTIEDGVVNDRFNQDNLARVLTAPGSMGAWAVNLLADWWVRWNGGLFAPPGGPHDFSTPEYAVMASPTRQKWETVRGLTASFGYNRNDDPSTHLNTSALVHLLVDVVAKNGNLLINIGPRADGTVPEDQARPLRGLGNWLGYAGEAVYDSQPWRRAEGEADGDNPVSLRFTRSKDHASLFIIALNHPGRDLGVFLIDKALPDTTVELLLPGGPAECPWSHSAKEKRLRIRVAECDAQVPPDLPAYAFRITPEPKPAATTLREYLQQTRNSLIFAAIATISTTLIIWHRVKDIPSPRRQSHVHGGGGRMVRRPTLTQETDVEKRLRTPRWR